MSTEKEDLEALQTHPGWLRLANYQRDYWSAQLSDLVAQAANDRDDAQALNKLRQCVAAKRATENLIAWPKERLSAMERGNGAHPVQSATEFPVMNRRGTL